MNRDIFEGKFKEISGELKKKWGQLTDDEIRQSEGDTEVLAGLLQQKLGRSRDEAEREVSDMLSALERKYSTQKVSDVMNKKIQKMKSKLKRS